jgi:hypothetical protein
MASRVLIFFVDFFATGYRPLVSRKQGLPARAAEDFTEKLFETNVWAFWAIHSLVGAAING